MKKFMIYFFIILLIIFLFIFLYRNNLENLNPEENIIQENEKNIELQEVESESFELQGEIAYEEGRSNKWNIEAKGSPNLIYISQIDSRWRNYPYTSSQNVNQTIGSSGCGVASCAMIINGIVGNISVKELADTFVKFGYRSKNSGTYWSANRAIADEFNIEYRETSNFDVMIEMLKNNNYVISSVGNGLFTTGGHYIVIYGMEGDLLKIYDPYLYDGKFDVSTRRGKVEVKGNTVYCSKQNFKKYANYKRFFCYKNNLNKSNEKNVSKNTTVNKYVNVMTRLNIRSGNGTSYKIIGKLNNGKMVTVYETRGNWSRIGDNMWVCSDYLKDNIKINTAGKYKILKSRTYLYSKSNLSGVKYTYLANTKVKIIKNINSNIDYVYVVKTGRYAYVNRNKYK